MYAGIDTHKDTLAVAVIGPNGRLTASCELPNTNSGFAELTDLLIAHRVKRVGIEGSGAYGRAVAVHLALEHSGGDLTVVEVPTLMTSRERRAKPGQGKTDPSTPSRSPASPPAKPPSHRSGSPSAPPQTCGPCWTTATN